MYSTLLNTNMKNKTINEMVDGLIKEGKSYAYVVGVLEAMINHNINIQGNYKDLIDRINQ